MDDAAWVEDWERRAQLYEASLAKIIRAHLTRQERVVIEKLGGAKTRQRYDRHLEAKARFGNSGTAQLTPARLASLMASAAVPGRPGAAARATLTRFGVNWQTGKPLAGGAPSTPAPSAPSAPNTPSVPSAPSGPPPSPLKMVTTLMGNFAPGTPPSPLGNGVIPNAPQSVHNNADIAAKATGYAPGTNGYDLAYYAYLDAAMDHARGLFKVDPTTHDFTASELAVLDAVATHAVQNRIAAGAPSLAMISRNHFPHAFPLAPTSANPNPPLNAPNTPSAPAAPTPPPVPSSPTPLANPGTPTIVFQNPLPIELPGAIYANATNYFGANLINASPPVGAANPYRAFPSQMAYATYVVGAIESIQRNGFQVDPATGDYDPADFAKFDADGAHATFTYYKFGTPPPLMVSASLWPTGAHSPGVSITTTGVAVGAPSSPPPPPPVLMVPSPIGMVAAGSPVSPLLGGGQLPAMPQSIHDAANRRALSVGLSPGFQPGTNGYDLAYYAYIDAVYVQASPIMGQSQVHLDPNTGDFTPADLVLLDNVASSVVASTMIAGVPSSTMVQRGNIPANFANGATPSLNAPNTPSPSSGAGVPQGPSISATVGTPTPAFGGPPTPPAGPMPYPDIHDVPDLPDPPDTTPVPDDQIVPTVSGLDELVAMGPIPRAKSLAATVQAHRMRMRAWIGGDPMRQDLADAAAMWIGDYQLPMREYQEIRSSADYLAKKPRGMKGGRLAMRHAATLMAAAATGPVIPRMYRGITVTSSDLTNMTKPGYRFTGSLDAYSLNRDRALAFGNLRSTSGYGGGNNLVIIEIDGGHGVPVSPLSHATGAVSYLDAEEILSSGVWETVSSSTASETPMTMVRDGMTPGSSPRTVTTIRVRQIVRGYDPVTGDEIPVIAPAAATKAARRDYPEIIPHEPMYPKPSDFTPDQEAMNLLVWVDDGIELPEVKGIHLPGIFDVAAFAKRLIDDALDWLKLMYGDWGSATARHLGAADWNPRDPAVVQAIENQAERMRGVAETTYKLIEQRIAEAEAEDLPMPDIVDRVAADFARQRETRAETIAVTEVSAAANTASFLAANQIPGATLTKTWWTMQDERVRPAHRHAHGQVADVMEPFVVGGVPMMFPHDPSAPLHLIINCRCRIIWKPVYVMTGATAPNPALAKAWSSRHGQSKARFGNRGGAQLTPVALARLLASAATPGKPGAAARATLTRFGARVPAPAPVPTPGGSLDAVKARIAALHASGPQASWFGAQRLRNQIDPNDPASRERAVQATIDVMLGRGQLDYDRIMTDDGLNAIRDLIDKRLAGQPPKGRIGAIVEETLNRRMGAALRDVDPDEVASMMASRYLPTQGDWDDKAIRQRDRDYAAAAARHVLADYLTRTTSNWPPAPAGMDDTRRDLIRDSMTAGLRGTNEPGIAAVLAQAPSPRAMANEAEINAIGSAIIDAALSDKVTDQAALDAAYDAASTAHHASMRALAVHDDAYATSAAAAVIASSNSMGLPDPPVTGWVAIDTKVDKRRGAITLIWGNGGDTLSMRITAHGNIHARYTSAGGVERDASPAISDQAAYDALAQASADLQTMRAAYDARGMYGIRRVERDAIFDALGQIRPFAKGRTPLVATDNTPIAHNFGRGHGAPPPDQTVIDALTWATDYYPSDWVDAGDANGPVYGMGFDRRGFFTQVPDPSGKMVPVIIASRSDPSPLVEGGGTPEFNETMAHEYGHYMEMVIPGLTDAEYALWYRRTNGGEGAISMNEAEGVPAQLQAMGMGYGPEEITAPDEFLYAYMGKIYPGGTQTNREMFTMAIESLVGGRGGKLPDGSRPKSFVQGDRDMANWLVGLLATLNLGPGNTATTSTTAGAPS